MTIKHTNENGKLTLALSGRIDTVTAPELEAALDTVLGDAKELVFDFNELEYISSRALLPPDFVSLCSTIKSRAGFTVSVSECSVRSFIC